MQFNEIFFRRLNLEDYPKHNLPQGYSFRFYKSGDKENWREIHRLSDEYNITSKVCFEQYFPKDLSLDCRQVYLCNDTGKTVGTATAWYDNFLGEEYGRIHWVAIIPQYQGKKLAKPLLSYILENFVKLGHKQVFLRTIDVRLNAIGLYLYFGFEPVIRNEKDLMIWQRIAEKVEHPKLVNLGINI